MHFQITVICDTVTHGSQPVYYNKTLIHLKYIAERKLFRCSKLLRTEDTVTCIAQAREDVILLVQAFVE